MLLKKHEAFERSAATQEERFQALERLTTVKYCCDEFLSVKFEILLCHCVCVSYVNYGF